MQWDFKPSRPLTQSPLERESGAHLFTNCLFIARIAERVEEVFHVPYLPILAKLSEKQLHDLTYYYTLHPT